jgi:hypothetical protein
VLECTGCTSTTKSAQSLVHRIPRHQHPSSTSRVGLDRWAQFETACCLVYKVSMPMLTYLTLLTITPSRHPTRSDEPLLCSPDPEKASNTTFMDSLARRCADQKNRRNINVGYMSALPDRMHIFFLLKTCLHLQSFLPSLMERGAA